MTKTFHFFYSWLCIEVAKDAVTKLSFEVEGHMKKPNINCGNTKKGFAQYIGLTKM